MKKKILSLSGILFHWLMAILGIGIALRLGESYSLLDSFSKALCWLSLAEALFTLTASFFLIFKKKGPVFFMLEGVSAVLWVPVLFLSFFILGFLTGILELPAQS